jgi:hypothetical protein
MKTFLTILCAFFILAKANAIPAPPPPLPFYMKLHYSPILVYATVSESKTDENRNTNGKLTIKEVIKGDLKKGMVLNVKFAYVAPRQGRVPIPIMPPSSKKTDAPQKVNNDGETRIYALSKNSQKETEDIVWNVSQVGFIVNAAQKVQTPGGFFSIPDFKAGIALFEAKYSYFEAKRGSNVRIIVENPTKNQTFAFLVKEMMGNLIYTPKTVRKIVKKPKNDTLIVKKVVKKHKKVVKKRKK